jgi:hypothetical protein
VSLGTKLARHGDAMKQSDYKQNKIVCALHGCSFQPGVSELVVAREDSRRGVDDCMEVTSLETTRKALGRPPYLG